METLEQQKVTDKQIIDAYLQSRDTSYFNVLYRKYSNKVYAKCISLLKDETSAQDATQDIFIKIFMSLPKFSGKSQFSTWVYSITYNYCIDLIRKRKKALTLFSDEIDDAPEPPEEVSDEVLLSMEVSRLKKVLDELPIGDKAILLMKYQDDMQIKEIAETTGKTESAVKMKIKRAKHKAQRVYNELFSHHD